MLTLHDSVLSALGWQGGDKAMVCLVIMMMIMTGRSTTLLMVLIAHKVAVAAAAQCSAGLKPIARATVILKTNFAIPCI